MQRVLDLGEAFHSGRDEARLRWLLHQCQAVDPKVDSAAILVFLGPAKLDADFELTASKLSARRIRAALGTIRAGIAAFVAGRAWRRHEGKIMRVLRRREEQNRLVYRGPLDAAFVAAAFDLVAAEGHTIRRCARDGCENRNVFLPRRRQEYCSKRCSNLERTRRFRENPVNRATASDRRRELYRMRQKGRATQAGRNRAESGR